MADSNKTKILLVDDDKFIIDMYLIKFGESGFQIEPAFSATEAIEKLKGGFVPDIYLVDIIMPGMDGFQLIREIVDKGWKREAVMVVLSNLGQKDDIERALSLGVDGYIVKASATPSEVVARVQEITKNRKKPVATP